MSFDSLRSSLSARAVIAIVLVFAGYTFLHTHFASFDARLVGAILGLIGFHVETSEPGRLIVTEGNRFDIYAIVTGTCSSAAGALGIAAAGLILLPGSYARRAIGSALGIVLFVALNVARIVMIVGIGWVFATVDRAVLLPVFVGGAVAMLGWAIVTARSPVTRMVFALVAVVLAALAYDAWQGYDYGAALGTYHALAGPMLTFASLSIALLVLWRVLVGRNRIPAAAAA